MKLYFWFLKSNFSGNEPHVVFKECEVIEKEKTYAPVEEFPCEYCWKYVKKSEIGILTDDYYKNLVITLEKDPSLPMKLFKERENNRINKLRLEILKSKRKIKVADGFLDEWRMKGE